MASGKREHKPVSVTEKKKKKMAPASSLQSLYFIIPSFPGMLTCVSHRGEASAFHLQPQTLYRLSVATGDMNTAGPEESVLNPV